MLAKIAKLKKSLTRRWKDKDRLVPIIHDQSTGVWYTCAGKPFQDYLNTLRYPRRDAHLAVSRMKVFLDSVEPGWAHACEIEFFKMVEGPRTTSHFVLVRAFSVPSNFTTSNLYGRFQLGSSTKERKKQFNAVSSEVVEEMIDSVEVPKAKTA